MSNVKLENLCYFYLKSGSGNLIITLPSKRLVPFKEISRCQSFIDELILPGVPPQHGESSPHLLQVQLIAPFLLAGARMSSS